MLAATVSGCVTNAADPKDPPAGFEHAYAAPGCAPWDGYAVSLVLRHTALAPLDSIIEAGDDSQLHLEIYPRDAPGTRPSSYASLPMEGVDWTLFDIIATDAGYRTATMAAQFRENVRTFVALGKPVAVTEFGCGTHRGAAEMAAIRDSIIVWGDDGRAVHLNGEYVRDEDEQATYARELLEVFETEGVDAAFVYTFARYDLPHRDNPRADLDMASAGVVKVFDGQDSAFGPRGRRYPDMPWEPKAAFDALAEWYSADGVDAEAIVKTISPGTHDG